jgi:hypothetical protein
VKRLVNVECVDPVTVTCQELGGPTPLSGKGRRTWKRRPFPLADVQPGLGSLPAKGKFVEATSTPAVALDLDAGQGPDPGCCRRREMVVRLRLFAQGCSQPPCHRIRPGGAYEATRTHTRRGGKARGKVKDSQAANRRELSLEGDLSA